MTRAFIQAVLDSRRTEAENLLGVVLPIDWPDEGDLRHLQRWHKDMAEENRVAPWRARAITLREGGLMIGHAGFHGPPDDTGTIEIGYAIFPPFRGNGYATEAARRLLEMAKEIGATTFRASVSPSNAPSLAVVRKLGLVKTGERMDDVDGSEFVFERPLG
ncbi:MAG TPA: GNAT family N-acetyltransferase [Actinomycetota bacterium]|nr:GNAT family N-acetyltransferase [Actinomycetota bacterium]